MIQVAVNLLGNALQAAGPGGLVRVSVQRVGNELVLNVDDSGPGIPADAMERLFEPFFTTKDPGKGTGLGLAISQSIVASFGGSIQVRSQVGEGTSVMLKLLASASRG